MKKKLLLIAMGFSLASFSQVEINEVEITPESNQVEEICGTDAPTPAQQNTRALELKELKRTLSKNKPVKK